MTKQWLRYLKHEKTDLIADISARTHLESMTPEVLQVCDKLADNIMRCGIVQLVLLFNVHQRLKVLKYGFG